MEALYGTNTLEKMLETEDKTVPINIKEFDYNIKGDDLYMVGDAYIDEEGLNGHHIKSANKFYMEGIKQIITEGFDIQKDIINRRAATPEDKTIERIHCEVKFTEVKIEPPTTLNYTTGKEVMLMPNTALLRDKIYSGPLYISCDVKAVAHLKNGSTIDRTDHVKDFRIAKVPIIKGSVVCNTYGKTKEALMQMCEDPMDPGGYFIVKSEWAVDCTESTTFNQEKIYINEGYGKSRVRSEYLSKPGDTYQNSDMIILIFNTDDTFTVEICRDKLNGIKIPFYLLFRAMGWSSDKEMMDWIIFDYESEANQSILNQIIAAIKAKYGTTNYGGIYNQVDALKAVVDLIPEENFKYLELKQKPENYSNAINEILRIFDVHFLPHIGLSSDYRHDKLKFLALLIRKVIMVYLRHIPQTDRDSYRIKRIHAAGDNYAKTFKTLFNQTVAMPIKKQMTKVFNATPFSQVNLANLVKSAIYVEDFERLIVQTIVSGNKSSLKIKRRTVTNRFMAQQLNRKNQLNMYATMRQVSSTSADSAKQSERAAEMRRVHMSSLGYICVVHSPPEGEKVGINKQMAIFASIAPSSSSEVLKKIILSDETIIPEAIPTPLEIYRNNYARVYVNGSLIGYTKDSIVLVNKYRQQRRKLELNPYTTIYWDNTQNEVQFFVDTGRMVRPLLIVYNNKRDKEVVTQEYTREVKGRGKKSKKHGGNSSFDQGIGITQQDIIDLYTKKKRIYDLIKEQKVEFITPEEQQNCFICPNFKQLRQDRYDELKEYTHCDIPQAILGITALTAPFGNHNQAPRVTYQTSQSKQTCGFYAGNWPFRIDKETFLQRISESPLIRTAVNKYIYPNGINCMVAMMCYTGYNQEDSLIISKAAVERGLFDGSKFTFYKAELEQKEQLGNPDVTKTEGIKSANYGKLINGVVERGTHIKEDDVLIGKYLAVPKGTGKDAKSVYVDRSIVYKDSEEAIVQNVVVDRNEDAMRFAKVGLRKLRPVAVGDKMCLSGDHEVWTVTGWKNIKSVVESDLIATLNPKTYNLEWHNPTKIYNYEHTGEMYEIETDLISLKTTLNHKMFVRDDINVSAYNLIEAQYIIGKNVCYYNSCNNKMKDIEYFNFEKKYEMRDWLQLNGIAIRTYSNGYISLEAQSILDKYKILYSMENHNIKILDDKLLNYFNNFQGDYSLPDWCKKLSTEQSNILLTYIIKDTNNKYHINFTSKKLIDALQILSMLAGHICKIDIVDNKYRLLLSMQHKEPSTRPSSKTEQIDKNYSDNIYCLEVPNHVFMVRRNNKYCWTGNSSRAGQKGIAACLMREADLPFNKEGIRPAIIFNPHGMPSRMTCSQVIEALIGSVCAIKGVHYDGTMFKDNDIESYAEILEQYGYNRYGYDRMISGITGEYIDTEIFFGPTYYQRLQKFVSDAEYSVRQALTDAVTLQPLDGQASLGGLRVGEMERDVLGSHGVSRFLREKFFNHSDGYTEYICRCGKPAIVNHRDNVYKCKYCKDNADITAIPTSWTSKLFMQEMQSCNVGIRRIPRPFIYEINDTQNREYSKIEEYNEETVDKINTLIKDSIDDSGAAIENE
jgi:DNA-directed RNA polymerase II subunit RPB2